MEKVGRGGESGRCVYISVVGGQTGAGWELCMCEWVECTTVVDKQAGWELCMCEWVERTTVVDKQGQAGSSACANG